MANRSYIYYTDNDASAEGEFKATGLSEYNYNIPTVYILLASCNVRSVPSKLFDDEPAIMGDFEKGKQLVIDLLAALAALYPDDETLGEFAETTADYLADCEGKYTLLENHEIYAMGEETTLSQNENIIAIANDYRETAEDLVRRYKAGQLALDSLNEADKGLIMDIEDELEELDDVEDFWTDILYYDLSGDDEDDDDE